MIQALVFCGAVAVLEASVIHFYSLAPLPLAFQMVPVAALLTVILTESSGKIEVVRAREDADPEEADLKLARKKKRRKR